MRKDKVTTKRKISFANASIAILLVLATLSICVSLFNISPRWKSPIQSSGGESTTITNLENIKLPTDGSTVIFKTPHVVNSLIANNELQSISKEGSILSLRENHTESKSAYADVKLANMGDCRAYSNYSHLTIEFDISVFDGATPLGCNVILVNRDNGNSNSPPYNSPATKLFIFAEGENLKVLTNSGASSSTSDTIHVTYVFEFNHDDLTKSHLQILFDGVVKYDSAIEGERVFTTDKVTHMGSLRIDGFAQSGGSIVFSELKVIGYNKTN